MLSCVLALLLSFNSTFPAVSSNEVIPMEQWTKEVGAKNMPDKQAVFSVNDYNAVNDGKTLATKSIQAAIDA